MMREILASPNGRLEVIFSQSEDGTPQYAVHRDGQELLPAATLGLELRGSGPLAIGLETVGFERRTHDETYPLLSGKSATARDHFQELTVALRERSALGRRLTLVFRAYDDGIAFRYVLPAQDALTDWEITAERTEFRFPGGSRCWALRLEGFLTPYESEFVPLGIGELTPSDLVGLPLTVLTPDGVALALTEAALTDWAGLYVQGASSGDGALTGVLAPLPDGGGGCVRGTGAHASPWRVIQIADTPAGLIESNIVLHLNPPQSSGDFTWVRPGKVAWEWWSSRTVSGVDFESGMNNATMKHYIDFAQEFGLEYWLLDGGWYVGKIMEADADITRSTAAIDLPMLIAYARERGVETLVWLHWKDIRDKMADAFALYERLGVAGVKVDFFDRDDQEIVVYCRNLVELAAKHHLLVDLHGYHKPTGWERTYPNLMTYEGIMGLEYNKWSRRMTPEHNVTVPYTRMLAGPMDYTPGAFHNVRLDEFEPRNKMPMAVGTRGHQLAMFVVYESHLQMVSDYPGAYRGQAGSEFLKAVPASWDETRAVGGAVGEWIALARRHGSDWFLGVMTDSRTCTLSLPLDFLGDGTYEATIYADGADAAMTPTQMAITTERVTGSKLLPLSLAPGGGAAVHFSVRH